MSLDVLIAGASGAGLKVLQILEDKKDEGSSDLNLIGFIDDNQEIWNSEYFGYTVFGGPAELSGITKGSRIGVICPIGDPVNRFNMIKRVQEYKVEFPNAIHPSAQISKKAQIGHGNVISQNAVVQAGVSIGNFNTFNISSILGPLSVVHDYCTINALVMVASETEVSSFTYIGMGAKIIQRSFLAEGTIVGASAFVNKESDPWTTVMGVPAKKIKQRRNPFNKCKGIE